MTSRKTAQTSFSVRLRDLRRALEQVLPFANSGDLIPTISCVHWDTDGKKLILTATDRYTIGRALVELDDDQTAKFAPFSMQVADVRRLLAIFKPARSVIPTEVTITTGPDAVVVSDESAALTCKRSEHPFPPLASIWRSVFTGAKEAVPTSAPRGLNPTFLARFICGNDPATFWPAKPIGPQLVTVNDWFCGAIMSVRLPDVPGQLELLEATILTAEPVAQAAAS